MTKLTQGQLDMARSRNLLDAAKLRVQGHTTLLEAELTAESASDVTERARQAIVEATEAMCDRQIAHYAVVHRVLRGG